MPIFKINKKIILFTHIPKCGGTSVEKYFVEIGSIMSFYDNKFHHVPQELRWNRSSPQHIDGASFERFFSDDFFDHKFVICRHPLNRLISAFGFHKFVQKSIDPDLSLDEFVQNKLLDATIGMGKYDNHFKHQYTFLPNNWKYDLFKFERGLNSVKHYIDMCTRGSSSPISMPHLMKAKNIQREARDSYLSKKSIEFIYEIYSKDFELFGYEKDKALTDRL